jgi:hypothetical protein
MHASARMRDVSGCFPVCRTKIGFGRGVDYVGNTVVTQCQARLAGGAVQFANAGAVWMLPVMGYSSMSSA